MVSSLTTIPSSRTIAISNPVISTFKRAWIRNHHQKLQEEGTKTPQAPVLGKVTIPEGYTIDQIATAITADVSTKKAGKTPFKKEDFLKAVQDDALLRRW